MGAGNGGGGTNGTNGGGNGAGAAAAAKKPPHHHWNEPRSAKPWRRTIDRATYVRILDGFREFPGNAAGAARLAGVDRRTAKRAWLYGWAASDFAPIKGVIEVEQAEARAQAAEQRAKAIAEEALDPDRAFPSLDRARAFLREAEAGAGDDGGERVAGMRAQLRRDALEAKVVESQIAKLSRQNAVTLLAANGDLLRGAVKLAAKIRRSLESEERVTTERGVRLMSSLASSTRHAVEAAQRAFELERQLGADRGREVAEAAMSVDDALRVLEDAAPTLDRLRSPSLTVIQGGEADRVAADDPELDAELDAEADTDDESEPMTTTTTETAPGADDDDDDDGPVLTISGDPVVFGDDDEGNDGPPRSA